MRLNSVVFSVLIGMGSGAAMAQKSAVQQPVRNYAQAHDSREQVPAFTPAAAMNPALAKAEGKLIVLGDGLLRNSRPQTCYVIDSHNYAATRSLVESPKATGQTTCVAANDSKLKGASRPVMLR